MNKIETMRVTVVTGAQGVEPPVRVRFNGHEIELEPVSGSTEAGATFEGKFEVKSVAHGVALLGPAAGTWSIERVVAAYETDEQIVNEYGPASLAAGDELDIWNPQVSGFDV